MHSTRDMTQCLIDYILDRLATYATFAQIGFDTGQDSTTICSIFMTAFLEWDERRGMNLPRILRIDEVYFNGEYFTGLSGATVDLLEGRSNDVIADRLKLANNRDEVEFLMLDFCGPFRDVATKPLGRPPKKKKKRFSAALLGDESGSPAWTPLFGDLSPFVSDKASNLESIQRRAEELLPLLPNVKLVADHYHFSAPIEKCFTSIRVAVQKSLFRYYLRIERKKYTRAAEIVLRGRETVEKEIQSKAHALAKERNEELQDNWKTLNKRPDKLSEEEWVWLKKIFGDHPLLRKGWDAKNDGLQIFPLKPKLGGSKNVRKAAEQKRVAQLMPPEEVARKLDAWDQSIDKEVRAYYQPVIELIERWRDEIIRIGTTPYTNAGAESKNRYLRMLEAIGRGLKFETLRARILWADAHPRPDRWPECCDRIPGRITGRKIFELHDLLIDQSGAEFRSSADIASMASEEGDEEAADDSLIDAYEDPRIEKIQ